MHWATPWVGLEYEELGRGPKYDCLGLYIKLTQVRFGVDMPDPLCTMRGAVRTALARSMAPLFRRVDIAQEGDALLFLSAGRPLHIAYALSNIDMLHINDTHGSLIERWNSPFWTGKLEGIYRRV